MKKRIIREYAQLLVKQGVNIQKKQSLVITADVEAADFVVMLAKEAYRAGAGCVTVDWVSTEITKLAYSNRTIKSLCEVPDWRVEKAKYEAETLPAKIRLICEDPDALGKANPEKVSRASIEIGKALKPYRDMADNKYQWLVCAVPGKAWAKKMFPGVSAAKAKEKLWEAILASVLVDGETDAIAAWDAKNAEFQRRCDKLNKYRFDYLRYKSSNGTDFSCALMNDSKWCGGGERILSGVFFNPNMPTEEIFTTPMKGRCEGRLVSTMPLSVRGTLIEDFYIDFRDGKASSWHAKKGEDALSKLLTTDGGSCMLGELALVPVDSAICQSGLLYYNTLFDENASCHVALGMGYTNCVQGYETKSADELHKMGVNDSMIHVDFMIGAPDLSITGYRDGKATPIFINGKWAQD